MGAIGRRRRLLARTETGSAGEAWLLGRLNDLATVDLPPIPGAPRLQYPTSWRMASRASGGMPQEYRARMVR